MKTLISASILAVSLFAGSAQAADVSKVFSDLNATAPRASIFDDINATAPRSGLFDQINDTAPRSGGVFGVRIARVVQAADQLVPHGMRRAPLIRVQRTVEPALDLGRVRPTHHEPQGEIT